MSITCPKCGSTEITGGTKGFGAGKAAAGLVVAGPLGLAAGAIGKNKAMNSCMACGYQWSPAKVAKAAQAQANKEALGSTGEWASALALFVALMIGLVTYIYVGFIAAVAATFVAFFIGIIICAAFDTNDSEESHIQGVPKSRLSNTPPNRPVRK